MSFCFKTSAIIFFVLFKVVYLFAGVCNRWTETTCDGVGCQTDRCWEWHGEHNNVSSIKTFAVGYVLYVNICCYRALFNATGYDVRVRKLEPHSERNQVDYSA